MANNAYTIAKGFRRQGVDATLIRDRSDANAMSQPCWVDARMVFGHEELSRCPSFSPEQWREKEEAAGWTAPEWVADPLLRKNRCKPFEESLEMSLLERLALKFIAGGNGPYWAAVLELMKAHDFVLSASMEGHILALASGRPFGIVPHGGDLRTALGLHKPKNASLRMWEYYLVRNWLLRQSLKKAAFIGSWVPRETSGVVNMPSKRPLSHFFIPYEARPRLDFEGRRRLLASLKAELGISIPDAKFLLFLPSRVDFHWKGTDRLLRALASLQGRLDFHLLVTGWGNDFLKAQELVGKDRVTFLPFVISRPILYDFFSAADMVVDQFTLGIYGTSATEAMSCGAPLMMWIDEPVYHACGRTPPPILNARTEDGIKAIFEGLLDGRLSLESVSSGIESWFAGTHLERAAIPVDENLIRQRLGGLV